MIRVIPLLIVFLAIVLPRVCSAGPNSGSDSFDMPAKELKSPDPLRRGAAVFSLRARQDYRSAGLLIPLLTDKDPVVRESVLQGLKELRGWGGEAALILGLQNRDPAIRAAAAKVTGAWRMLQARRWLKGLLQDIDPAVRKEAQRALLRLDRVKLHTKPADKNNVTLPPTLVICHSRGLEMFGLNRNRMRYQPGATAAFTYAGHLTHRENTIYAASNDTVAVFDTRLNLQAKKTVGCVGTIAACGDFLLVALDGNLSVLDKQLNSRHVMKTGLNRIYREKNIHDIWIHKNTAYLLDNIIIPAIVFTADISRLPVVKQTGRHSIRPMRKGGPPHLMGHWLNPASNQWVILSSLGAWKGSAPPGQKLDFIPILGNVPPKDRYNHSSRRNAITILTPPLESHGMLVSRSISRDTGYPRLIAAASSCEPVWGLIETGGYFYLARMRTVKPVDLNESAKAFAYHIDFQNRVLLSSYYPLGKKKRVTVKMKLQDPLLFVLLGGRLLIFDVSGEPQLLFLQHFNGKVTDFIWLQETGAGRRK